MTKVNCLRIITLLFVSSLSQGLSAQSSYVKQLQHERDSVNHVFADPESSILTPEALEHFEGLSYYPIDVNFRVKATFKKLKRQKSFQMITSTDRLPTYVAYGRLEFKIDGEKQCLTVYQNLDLIKNMDYADYLFIPFLDATSGLETYGAGRYMDITIGELEDEPVVDFNTCYNPYCAYNDRYSCPVPPSANHLSVEIRAGVKYLAH